ncbi:cysteine-rich receptor-like protein kinase 8 [Tanacetum coccineum]
MTVNMAIANEDTLVEITLPPDYSITARMDQLQNQLNLSALDDAKQQCRGIYFSLMQLHVSTSHANVMFELVHMDVWGLYNHFTVNKCKLFLKVVDDFSRATWIYLLLIKHHVA